MANVAVEDRVSGIQTKDASSALLRSMPERAWAELLRQEGARVISHRGRYWEEVPRGFYQPVHWLARLNVEEATRPRALLWGFRAALNESEANGSVPVYLLSDVQGYDMQSFSSNRRNHLRRCRKRVELVQLSGPALLEAQGHAVVASALERTEHETLPSKEAYIKSVTKRPFDEYRLVLAGLIEGKLGGYLDGYAVDGTAYIEQVYIATSALSTYLGTGLVYDFVQACRRSGEIREVVYGLHSREDEALGVFKEGMGFSVVQVPAKVQVQPLVARMLRWRYPHKYYRLTGRK